MPFEWMSQAVPGRWKARGAHACVAALPDGVAPHAGGWQSMSVYVVACVSTRVSCRSKLVRWPCTWLCLRCAASSDTACRQGATCTEREQRLQHVLMYVQMCGHLVCS